MNELKKSLMKGVKNKKYYLLYITIAYNFKIVKGLKFDTSIFTNFQRKFIFGFSIPILLFRVKF